MNDFTKEELECLENAIQIQLAQIPMSQVNFDKRTELRDKLQSMLDNYCEPSPNKPNFTQEQKNFICYQIGDWYLMMKPLLEGHHNLGDMKEKLKIMVCDDEMPTNC